ncbi:hypothetical protein JXA80_07115 [bacterium]|nr:hypothetical protein [candidate division CSSED10-310 bacterium]
MKKIGTIIVMLALVTLGGTLEGVHAGKGEMRGGMGMGARDGMPGLHPLLRASWDRVVDIAREAGVSDDQLEKLKTVRQSFREANGSLDVQLKNNHAALRELMVDAGESDQKAAMDLADEITRLQGQLFRNSITATFQIKGILTEDQINNMRECVDERRENRRERGEQRGSRRGRGMD